MFDLPMQFIWRGFVVCTKTNWSVKFGIYNLGQVLPMQSTPVISDFRLSRLYLRREKKLISPLPRGGRRISSSLNV